MRRFHFKQDYLLVFFFIGLIFLIIALLGCLLWLKHLSTLQLQSSDERYESYRIAQELRTSSDDLTKMVRLYVVTGDKKYLDYFNEILSIRNGTSPRPERYDTVYWDLVFDNKRPKPYGKPKSLVQMMIERGFSLQEFDLLRQAQESSNALAAIEIKAMNAAEGKFDNGTGQYTLQGEPDKKLAINLVFGKEYMEAKAKIMAPIQLFIEKVIERTTQKNKEFSQEITRIISLAIILAVLSTVFMLISISKALHRISSAAKENELLLLNILPSAVAERLKKGEKIIADEYPQASILFCDIVDFTSMMVKIGTSKMFDILGHLFDELDDLAQKYGVEKIKTIGDSYMAAAGIPEPAADHAFRMADFALAIKEKAKEFSQLYGIALQVRIGMTCGAVIAGVIGHRKIIYDVWGDVVNTASRMEATNIPGEIQITEKMALLLEEHFVIEERDEIEVKGKGKMRTYFLKGRR
ncbi:MULTISPECIES: adenylate/guanylate cyclase domain-containing protein [Legionella]|uniref:Guanylate cyclase n=1 Tax=Legionella maceachernii TaxID=466 RepID=A0A0W0VX36_9GAMM|nr:adenylate/guanylate cyclase domain-containing protein [Legionella maceachernii]KTD24478.1 guanylate cyclase [Legionella maceachernii]SJZ60047.1 Adenylate cyclase, class 3 [Legionella maceachernii]SUP00815.1 Adenylate cyclase [Legionella maceachernii]